MKTINFQVQTIIGNPEDIFEEMINDGYSVGEALDSIIREELADQYMRASYPDYRPDYVESDEYGNFTVSLVPIEEKDDLLIGDYL